MVNGSFVVKKDIYENCLVLYPMDAWESQVADLQQRLNPYNKTHNAFLRKFFSDTAELTLDANNRILLPKRLLEKVGIERDVALIGVGDKIEIWAVDALEAQEMNDSDFADLAQSLLGGDLNGEDDK